METRIHFLANACHVCKSKATPVACEICRMIFYCSPEHRRDNWFDHSELCWAVSRICQSEGGNCLWELRGGKDFTKFRHEVAFKCTQLLKRSLKPWEFEMIYYPRMCAVCREFDWTALSLCKDCEFVFTCGKAHFREDHRKWCKTMKLYSDLILCQSHGKPVRVEITIKHYKSMSEVLEKNSKPEGGGKRTEVEKALKSELLTYPLTVAEGLKAVTAFQEQQLMVLFIGAEVQAEVEPLDKWEKFLLHLIEGVQSLKLTFLGPELRESGPEFCGDLCEVCRKKKKICKFEFIGGKLYHEYSGAELPSLICAFNSGMYRYGNRVGVETEASKPLSIVEGTALDRARKGHRDGEECGFGNENSWEETIRKLFTRGNPPVLITEYTRRELGMVVQRISNLCGDVDEIVPPQMNPFASLKPGLNILSEEETPVIFKNYFYTILRKK